MCPHCARCLFMNKLALEQAVEHWPVALNGYCKSQLYIHSTLCYILRLVATLAIFSLTRETSYPHVRYIEPLLSYISPGRSRAPPSHTVGTEQSLSIKLLSTAATDTDNTNRKFLSQHLNWRSTARSSVPRAILSSMASACAQPLGGGADHTRRVTQNKIFCRQKTEVHKRKARKLH